MKFNDKALCSLVINTLDATNTEKNISEILAKLDKRELTITERNILIDFLNKNNKFKKSASAIRSEILTIIGEKEAAAIRKPGLSRDEMENILFFLNKIKEESK